MEEFRNKRLLFVCGLHRSGTTPITRLLGNDSRISIFEDTGVIEDEGQFLQDVFPRDEHYGGVGAFALNPSSHWTEETTFAEQERERLIQAWSPHWNLESEVLVEKSPANLTRTRYLQKLFPNAAFLFVTRHPAAACMAVSKWTGAYMTSLMTNWVVAHQTARSDSSHLNSCAWIRYEDIGEDPEKLYTAMEDLVGFRPELDLSGWRAGVNEKYFSRYWRGDYLIKGPWWKRMLKKGKHFCESRYLAYKFRKVAKSFGYDL